jgi:hypothetical protein
VKKGTAMFTCYRDPTLTDLLNDPLTLAVMQADGVNPQQIESLFRDLARRRAELSRYADRRQ